MRKIYFSLLCMFMGLSMSMGQSERTVLVEEFTNASCPPCASQNPGFNAVLDDVADENVISLKYQTAFPGYDPMNERNPGDVVTRWNYYSAIGNERGVPEAHIDGVPVPLVTGAYIGAPASVTAEMLRAKQIVESPVSVNVSHTLSAGLDSAYVSVEVVNEGAEAWDGSALKLRVALAEREIIFSSPPGSTDEAEFYDVFRSFINDGGAAGTTLDSIEAGSSLSFDYAVSLPSFYDLRQIEVIAFVQSDAAGTAIINAAKSSPVEISNITEVNISNATEVPSDYCADEVALNINVVNEGDIEVNSITVVNTLNGVDSEPITVDGLSLASGASETVSVGSLTLTPGTSLYSTSVTAVNGGVDINALNNVTTSTFLNKFSDNAEIINEGFEGYAFDDEGDFTDEAEYGLGIAKLSKADVSGLTQELGGYGESASSVIIDFYGWNPASFPTTGYMAYGQMDLTTVNNPILTFDRACADYTSPTNDGMEVEISTDCGVTWTSIYSNYGASLRTAAATASRYFALPADWVTDTVSLADYADENLVSMRYKFVSNYGNALYIDNVVISESPTRVNEVINEDLLSIAPNPAAEYVNLSMSLSTSSDVTLTVTDLSGRVVDQVNYGVLSGVNNFRYDNYKLNNGMYLFKINAGTDAIVRKVSILK